MTLDFELDDELSASGTAPGRRGVPGLPAVLHHERTGDEVWSVKATEITTYPA